MASLTDFVPLFATPMSKVNTLTLLFFFDYHDMILTKWSNPFLIHLSHARYIIHLSSNISFLIDITTSIEASLVLDYNVFTHGEQPPTNVDMSINTLILSRKEAVIQGIKDSTK